MPADWHARGREVWPTHIQGPSKSEHPHPLGDRIYSHLSSMCDFCLCKISLSPHKLLASSGSPLTKVASTDRGKKKIQLTQVALEQS